MSKDCNRCLSCKVCNQTHPTVLHIGKVDKEKGMVQGTAEDSTSHGVLSASGHIRAGEKECALTIVPIKVNSKKGNEINHTYPFLDRGSTATFCTDKLMHQLNIRGKETNVLLCTMGQEKTVSSDIVLGLEVSELHPTRPCLSENRTFLT